MPHKGERREENRGVIEFPGITSKRFAKGAAQYHALTMKAHAENIGDHAKKGGESKQGHTYGYDNIEAVGTSVWSNCP
jgi:hypothetical protein